MYTKLYDVHFEVGAEQQLYYARNVLGNNAIEFKQFSGNIADALSMCVSDMSANGAFHSLMRDPSLSMYPIQPHQHNYMFTTQGHGGGHNHSHAPATPAIMQYFDLHIECAIDSATAEHHSKATFLVAPGGSYQGNGLMVYHSKSKFLDDAICDMFCDMEGDCFFDDLLKNPLMSQYPLPGTGQGTSSASPSAGSVSSTSSSKNEDVVRKRPVDIGNDALYPACQDICQAYDHFKDKKCRSFCEWRF